MAVTGPQPWTGFAGSGQVSIEVCSFIEDPIMKINHVLAALGLAIALPALAQDAPPPAPQMPPMQMEGHGMPGRMAAKLKLTDAQKASTKEVYAKHQAGLAAKAQAAREARRAFFEAVQSPETTPEVLKGLHRTMSDADLDALLERRAMRLEIRALLTPDQREQAARMLGRKEGMRMGHGMGGMRGGHPVPPPAPAP